jgi:hypothetical protein
MRGYVITVGEIALDSITDRTQDWSHAHVRVKVAM